MVSVLRGEFIGLKVRVLESENTNNSGKGGIIVDETKNILTIETSEGVKKLIKNQCVFEFTNKDHTILRVDGKRIALRPEERIKKLRCVK